MERIVRYIIVGFGIYGGSFVPTLFGASSFDGWSILGSLIGGMFAVWVIYKMAVYL